MRVAIGMLALIGLAAAPPPPERPKAGWVAGERTRHGLSGVTLPRTAATLTLASTEELTPSGRNSIAQYRDEYGEVLGTVYVYSPGIADAGLTAVATTNVILKRFGPDARIAEQRRAPVTAGAVYRMVFEAGATATALAVGHLEGWIVKVRVSGPAGQRTSILAALDAITQGLTVGAGRSLDAPVALPSICSAASPVEARPLRAETADALSLGILSTPLAMQSTDPKLRLPLPRWRPSDWCVESVVAIGGVPIIVMRGAPARESGIALGRIALIGDGGYALDVANLGPTGRKDGKTPVVARLSTTEGRAVIGLFNGWPSAAQVAATVDAEMSGSAQRIVETTYDEEKGEYAIKVNGASLTDMGPPT